MIHHEYATSETAKLDAAALQPITDRESDPSFGVKYHTSHHRTAAMMLKPMTPRTTAKNATEVAATWRISNTSQAAYRSCTLSLMVEASSAIRVVESHKILLKAKRKMSRRIAVNQ
jgi:hypothetical protein